MRWGFLLSFLTFAFCDFTFAALKYQNLELSKAEYNQLHPELQKIQDSTGMIRVGRWIMADGLEKRPIIIGKNGARAVLATSGTYTNAQYMKDAAMITAMSEIGYVKGRYSFQDIINEIKNGKILVILDAPRKFNAGLFQVVEQHNHHKFGLAEMIADYIRSVQIAYAMSGQKIYTIGHSLGGLVADLADLGIFMDKSAGVYISKIHQKLLKEQVALKILLGVPFALQNKGMSFKVQFLLNKLAPWLLTNQKMSKKIYKEMEKSLVDYDRKLLSVFSSSQKMAQFISFGSKNSAHIDVVDFSLLEKRDIKTLFKFSTADAYPEKLLADYVEMAKTNDLSLELRGSKELSLIEAYKNTAGDLKVPTILVVSESDSIARLEDVRAHFKLLQAQGVDVWLLVLKGGHLNSGMGVELEKLKEELKHVLQVTNLAEAREKIENLVSSCGPKY